MDKGPPPAELGKVQLLLLTEEEQQEIRDVIQRSMSRSMTSSSLTEDSVARRMTMMLYRDPPGVCEMYYF
jgi:hypothetical protein